MNSSKVSSRCGGIAEVVFIYLADGEQRFQAILAAGVLAAQELILADGGTEVLLVRLKLASHGGQEFGNRHDAGSALEKPGAV